MINHNTFNIAEQYMGHVRIPYADMPHVTDKVKQYIYSKSRPDGLIIVHATLT